MQVRVKENLDEIGRCGCGRSPTGKCIGWHGLTEEVFQVKLLEHKQQKMIKEQYNASNSKSYLS